MPLNGSKRITFVIRCIVVPLLCYQWKRGMCHLVLHLACALKSLATWLDIDVVSVSDGRVPGSSNLLTQDPPKAANAKH